MASDIGLNEDHRYQAGWPNRCHGLLGWILVAAWSSIPWWFPYSPAMRMTLWRLRSAIRPMACPRSQTYCAGAVRRQSSGAPYLSHNSTKPSRAATRKIPATPASACRPDSTSGGRRSRRPGSPATPPPDRSADLEYRALLQLGDEGTGDSISAATMGGINADTTSVLTDNGRGACIPASRPHLHAIAGSPATYWRLRPCVWTNLLPASSRRSAMRNRSPSAAITT